MICITISIFDMKVEWKSEIILFYATLCLRDNQEFENVPDARAIR